jgi:hypothetical protein
MLMKILVTLTMLAAEGYNDTVAEPLGWRPVPPEVWVRFPSALFGALTALALYLVASLYFDRRVGLFAAWLWAGGINAIVVNRIAKEDTLMVFFILLGFYFHRRMKTTPEAEARRKRAFYFLSAASFGLMLAAKYFPHYLGLNLLYFAVHRKLDPAGYPADAYTWRDMLRYMAVFALVFIVFNPMLLSSPVLQYLRSYTGLELVAHTGYYMAGRLWPSGVEETPLGGPPWYFYLLYLAVKTPLAVLGAAALGLAACVRLWRAPGPFLVLFWLVFWLVPYSLFGVKFMRYTLSLMPAIYMAAAYGIRQLAEVTAAAARSVGPHLRAGWVAVGIPVFVLVLPLAALTTSNPFYSLYVSALGGGKGNAGFFFPHDEYYDLDLREAIGRVLPQAPPGSVVAGETPEAFRYYLEWFGRPDVRTVNLSDRGFELDGAAVVFVFLQPGRRYYENVAFFGTLWDRPNPVLEIRVMNQPAIRVQAIAAAEFLAIAGRRGSG